MHNMNKNSILCRALLPCLQCPLRPQSLCQVLLYSAAQQIDLWSILEVGVGWKWHRCSDYL